MHGGQDDGFLTTVVLSARPQGRRGCFGQHRQRSIGAIERKALQVALGED